MARAERLTVSFSQVHHKPLRRECVKSRQASVNKSNAKPEACAQRVKARRHSVAISCNGLALAAQKRRVGIQQCTLGRAASLTFRTARLVSGKFLKPYGVAVVQCSAASVRESASGLHAADHHSQHQSKQAADISDDEPTDGSKAHCCTGDKQTSEAQSRAPLLEALVEAAARNDVLLGTPGHQKGVGAPQLLRDAFGAEVFKHDIAAPPLLPALAEAEQLAAAAFGADRTWFLTNGSTCGVQAAVMATCRPGDVLVLPRNCHQSAVSAMVLSGARPKYVLPDFDPEWGIPLGEPPLEVQRALTEAQERGEKVGAVLIVSPTYHGICSDLAATVEICHSYGVPLIVDEAHGGHFNFHPTFPKTALECGADVTVQSTHKVLTAFTQAAMLHSRGARVSAERIDKALQLLQTSVRSPLLLSSLDAARMAASMQNTDGVNTCLDSAFLLAVRARFKLAALPKVQVLTYPEMDPLRVAVHTTGLGLSGFEADEILVDKFGVIAELPWQNGLVFAIGPGTTEEHVNRLVSAFTSLSESTGEADVSRGLPLADVTYGDAMMTPREAFFCETERVKTASAIGRICGELLCPYPPGIPVLTPGEIVTSEAVNFLTEVVTSGGMLTGADDSSLATIAVISDASKGGAEPSEPDSGFVSASQPLDQARAPLFEALAKAALKEDAPFYFPGHKKGSGASKALKAAVGQQVFKYDLPEIPGLDNLACPEGAILEAQQLAAAAFGAERTWFLVNGPACGIQAAVMATCKQGEVLILPRNYTHSALSSLVLSGARPHYVSTSTDPGWGAELSVRPEAIERALWESRDSGARVGAVLIQSPTVYGTCSDVTAIARTCHAHHVPLIVDESYGADFGFHNALPPTALASGADVSVQATYEGLSSFTQAAMLHVTGGHVSAGRLDRALQTLQSSSPSYLLLSSLDVARLEAVQADENGNNPRLESALGRADKVRADLRALPGMGVLEGPEMDPLRVAVKTTGLGLPGYKADEILAAEFGVKTAFSWQTGVVFALGMGTTEGHVTRLVSAFTQLSQAANGGPPLLKRSEVSRDLDVLEEECSRQLAEAVDSWQGERSLYEELANQEVTAVVEQARGELSTRNQKLAEDRRRGSQNAESSSVHEGERGSVDGLSGQDEAVLQALRSESLEELRLWANKSKVELKALEQSTSLDMRTAFEHCRIGITGEYEDPRGVLLRARELLEDLAAQTGKLPKKVDMSELKQIFRRFEIKAGRVLEPTLRDQRSDFLEKPTDGCDEEARTVLLQEENGDTPSALFTRVQKEVARRREISAPRKILAEAEAVVNRTSKESRVGRLLIAFERAKRGCLEAASLAFEAQQLMAYGSGKKDGKGPLTGQQKEALSRNESAAATLRYASEDLVLIRYFGGLPKERKRVFARETASRKPLEEALKLELRRASRVARSAQVQLQEVLEGLEPALISEEKSPEEERMIALRNECVHFHVGSALEHLKRAYGDLVTDWDDRKKPKFNGRSLDQEEVVEPLADPLSKQEDARTTPREAFFER